MTKGPALRGLAYLDTEPAYVGKTLVSLVGAGSVLRRARMSSQDPVERGRPYPHHRETDQAPSEGGVHHLTQVGDKADERKYEPGRDRHPAEKTDAPSLDGPSDERVREDLEVLPCGVRVVVKLLLHVVEPVVNAVQYGRVDAPPATLRSFDPDRRRG